MPVQTHLRFDAGVQPQFRIRFPRPLPRLAPKNPWLETNSEWRFKTTRDGRKWKARCWLKRQICRGYEKLGHAATARELSGFLRYDNGDPIPLRTIEWGIKLLKADGIVTNVRRQGWNGPMLRELHPECLAEPTQQNITYRTQLTDSPSLRQRARILRSHSPRILRSKFPQESRGPVSGFSGVRGQTIPQDLGAGLRRRSSPPSVSHFNPQNRHSDAGSRPFNPTTLYAGYKLLTAKAIELLRAGFDGADLADELKCFAAQRGIDYSRTPAGKNSPIVQAITVAILQLGDPHGQFAPFARRR